MEAIREINKLSQIYLRNTRRVCSVASD